MKRKTEKKLRFNQKGITLIALVITIIVLLILAGVSIATLTGENGILTRANEASKKTEVANEQEQVGLAYIAASSSKWGEEITLEEVQNELDKLVGENKTKATENGNGTINVEFLDTKNNYNISEEGKVTKVDENAISYEILYEYEEVEGGISITDLTNENLVTTIYIEKIHENDPDFSIEFLRKFMLGDFVTEEEMMEELNKLGITVEEFQSKLQAANEGIDMNAIYDEMEPMYEELLKEVGNIPKKIDGKEVVEIGRNAFKNSELTKLVIPNTVKKIGESAFYRCSLKEISISNSVIEIGVNAFSNNSLTDITIPSSVTTIGNGAFTFNQLTKVVFESTPIVTGFTSVDNFRGIFNNNITLTANSIKVPTGTIDYFTTEREYNWWGISNECFYE